MRRHRHLTALTFFAGVVVVVYFSVILGERSLLTNDLYQAGPRFVVDPYAGGPISLPLEQLATQSWIHLHLPIVDPYQGYGISLLSNQSVPVYPPQLLLQMLLPHNYSIWNLINLVAIAFGVYALASAFGQRFFGALAAGLAAALAGIVPPNLNMAMLNPFAVLPFVLLSIRYAVDPSSRHRPVAVLGCATSVALLSLSGFPEVLPLFAVVIVVYTAAMLWHFKTWQRSRVRIAWTALAGLVGVVIGSVGLLPTFSALGSGSTVNGPGGNLTHVPEYWLSTLTVPTVAGRAMGGQPQDLGHSIWTLGTPVFIATILLAAIVATRPGGRRTGWYIWPSIALVLYGVVAYAGDFHSLSLLSLPVFNAISTFRLLQFAWWIPWCLLLGAVVSNAHLLRWRHLLASFIATVLFDAIFVLQYRHALLGNHMTSSVIGETTRSTIVALALLGLFLFAAGLRRWIGTNGTAAAMAAVVLGSCLYYLPTNFFPASGGSVVNTFDIAPPHQARGNYLGYFNGVEQQPVSYYSVQIWGPIIPAPYRKVLNAAFSAAQTNGYGPTFDQVPTLGFANVDPHFVSIIGDLGVNTLVTENSLSGSLLGAIPNCARGSGSQNSAPLCFLGRTVNRKGQSGRFEYAYEVVKTSPLVDANAVPIAVSSNSAGLSDFVKEESPASNSLPSRAYVTTTDQLLTPARGVVGVSHVATTQSQTYSVRTRSKGLVVLRTTYLSGLHASVNGQNVTAYPVDGGMWTAVVVPSGRDEIVLDYVGPVEVTEFMLAFLGLFGLLVAWCVLAWTKFGRTRDVRRRRVGATEGHEAPVRSNRCGRTSTGNTRSAPVATASPALD
jgi:hypothetical protein